MTKNCQSCNTDLLPNALYCHNCGKQADGDGVVCFECKNVNPNAARFCARCGNPINIKYTPKPNITPIYGIDFNDIPTLPTQLHEAFKVFVCWALEQEHQSEKEAFFLQTLEKSSFRQEYLEEATVLMTQEFESLFETYNINSFEQIEAHIEKQFTRLLERFFVDFCNPFLPKTLSKNILLYQDANLQDTNLHQMTMDYLDIDNENITAYTHAIDIPLKKIKNARTTFFQPTAGEIPYVFIDQTLLGSGKEGFILTAKAIYWKAYFQKSAQVRFSEIEKLVFFSDRLEINNIYFNVNPSFNYKLYRLLFRLRTL